MIITQSPLRITLGGGGTDLPSYYQKNEGFLISAAIDKYVYLAIHKNFIEEIRVKYSKEEIVKTLDEIEHPIVREAMKIVKLDNPFVEIVSIADIPSGTGLGSSGSFTTALLKALYEYKGEYISTKDLAEKACDIEINRLKEPVGKQDQYIAAYGGLNCMTFHKDGYVDVEPLNISNETLYNLEDNLILYFTGMERTAAEILRVQDDKTRSQDADMKRNLDNIKEMGYLSKKAFETGNLAEFADIMNVHWEYKKKRATSMTNEKIDEWYEYARKNGALGGKLIGAGGGGFLMFYSEETGRLRKAMSTIGLEEVRFKFESVGTKTIL